MLLSFQPMRNLTVKGMETDLRMASKISRMRGRSRSRPLPPLQATTRLAGQLPRLRSDEVEACLLADARAVGEGFRVGAEELRGDRVLVLVVGQVALALGFAHAGEAIGGGELRHDEAAAGDLVAAGFDIDLGSGGNPRLRIETWGTRIRVHAGVFDEAAEDGVSDAGHGGEDAVAGAMRTGPMCNSAGTRAVCGMARAAVMAELSHSFFM